MYISVSDRECVCERERRLKGKKMVLNYLQNNTENTNDCGMPLTESESIFLTLSQEVGACHYNCVWSLVIILRIEYKVQRTCQKQV